MNAVFGSENLNWKEIVLLLFWLLVLTLQEWSAETEEGNDARFAWAAGAQVTFSTAHEEEMGSGK